MALIPGSHAPETPMPVGLLKQTARDAYTPELWQYEAATRVTTFGEYMYESAAQALSDFTTPGRMFEELTTPPRLPTTGVPDEMGGEAGGPGVFTKLEPEGALDEDTWRGSRWYREGIQFDAGMTEARAQALAESYDRRRWRDSLYARYQGGIAGRAAAIGAQFLVGAADPLNYIPILGPASRAAAIARLGPMAGRVAVSATEGAIGNLLVSPYLYATLEARGEDFTAADLAIDLALGAAAGGVFGAGAGVLAKRRAASALRYQGLQESLDGLEAAAQAVAHGEPVEINPIAQRWYRTYTDRFREGTAPARPFQQPDVSAPETPLAGAQFTSLPFEARPQSLIGFLRKIGGLRDEGGELSAMNARARRGLVREKGLSLEEAAMRAAEAGYFENEIRLGEFGEDQGQRFAERDLRSITPDMLLEAIDDEMRGRRRYAFGDQERAVELEAAREDRLLDEQIVGVAEEHGGISGNELAIARTLIKEHDMDFEDAIVEALTMAALRNEGGEFDGGVTADDFDIPFDEIPGRAGGSTGAGGPTGAAPPFVREGADLGQPTSEQAIERAVRAALATERVDPPHPSVVEAQAKVGKGGPELDSLEQEMRLAGGGEEGADIPEMADVELLRKQGLLTEADEVALKEADETAKLAEGYATAYESLSTCVLRFAP